MKLNWGNALLIFFIIYIGLLVRIVIKSIGVDHTLVVENYYEHDLSYQDKLDKIQNRQWLAEDLKIGIDVSEKTLNLDFGGGDDIVEAKVEMYRASDKSADFSENLTEFDSITKIAIGSLQNGLWKVRVEWKDAQRTYFKEENVYI